LSGKSNIIQELKSDSQELRAKVTLIEEQLRSIVGQGQTGEAQNDTTQLLANFKGEDGRIDFEGFDREMRESMYQVRQLTMALRGYVMLAREAGLLDKDSEKAYQNIMRVIRMAYQAQRALEQLDRMMKIAEAGMMTNPVGFAVAAVSFGGRIAGSLAYANRTSGTSGV
jgi:hypothetical protein